MPQIPSLLKNRSSETKKTIETISYSIRVNVKSKVCALFLPKSDISVHINKTVEKPLQVNIYDIIL